MTFAPERLPGVHGQDYIYPGATSFDYWHEQGVRLIRVMVQWERLQPQLGGEFSPDEQARLDQIIDNASRRGMKIIIGPHNYARYSIEGKPTLIGTPRVPRSAFADLWHRLAKRYRATSAIFGYSLMNEPHDTGGTWKETAQAGLDAIRAHDPRRLVLVPGDHWSSAWHWPRYNADLLLKDPSHCLMYEAHLYFDANGSGFYDHDYDTERAYNMVGVDRVQPFLKWLKSTGQAGIITEFGIANDDPRWLPVLANFIDEIRRAGVGGTYWAAGPWWGDYKLSLEPKNGKPAPAMVVMSRHFRDRRH